MQIDKTHHALYVALHAARSAAPELWSDQHCTHVLTTIMGRRSWSWRVVGITPAALDALAAVSFYNRKELGLVRAHLVNRIDLVRHLMHLPQPATCEYFVSYWTTNDRTVLVLRRENGKDGFAAYLPFDAPGLFSSERLAGWVHGKAERAFLQGVHTRRPTPVTLSPYQFGSARTIASSAFARAILTAYHPINVSIAPRVTPTGRGSDPMPELSCF